MDNGSKCETITKACKSIDGNYPKWWGKIIATTNPSLNLPNIPDSFIQEYCEKGGIDEVIVEYDSIDYCHASEYCKGETIECDTCEYSGCILKINPDNTISIHPVKETYTREEVIELLKKAIVGGFKITNEFFYGEYVLNTYNEIVEHYDFNEYGEKDPRTVLDELIKQNL